MIEIEGPDGVIYEFPAGTSDDEIAKAMQLAYPTGAPDIGGMGEATANLEAAGYGTDMAIASKPPRDLAPVPLTPGQSFQLGAQGVGRATADIAGFLPDLAAALFNLGLGGTESLVDALPGEQNADFGRVTNPIGGSENLSDIASALMTMAGAPPIDPAAVSGRDRFGYNVNRFGTEGLLGGVGLARRAAAEAATVGPKLPTMIGELTKPYMDAPARAVATDTMAGVGSGAALTGAQELPAEYQGPITDALAMMAGGIGGSVASSVAHSPKAIAQGVRGMMTDSRIPVEEGGLPYSRREADMAARFVQDRASNPAQAAETIATRADDFRANAEPIPTTDLISEDIGVMALGKGKRATDKVPFEERDQALRDAATSKVVDLRNDAADPRAPQKVAATKADEMRDDADWKRAGAERNVTAATGGLDTARQEAVDAAAPIAAARGTEGQASQRLDEVVVDQTMRPRGEQRSELIEKVDAKGAAKVDPESIQGVLNEISGRAGKLTGDRSLPTEFTDRISRFVDDGEPVTVKDLNELRPYLTKAHEAARRNGEVQLSGDLQRLRRLANDEVDKLAARGDVDAAEAQRYYREEYAPFFAEGKGKELRDAINRDSPDRVNTPPSRTAERFLIAGGKGSDEAADDLRRIIEIAPDPAAGTAAVRDYMVARLAQTVNADGTITPATLGRWIDNHQDILAKFPEVGDEVRDLRVALVNNAEKQTTLKADVDRFGKELKAAERNVTDTERRIQQGHLGIILNNDPENAVKRVLGAGDPEKAMDEVVRLVKPDHDAREGWKRAVSDYLIDQVTTSNSAMRASGISEGSEGAVSLASLQKTFARHEKSLAKVYSPEEMNALRRAHKMLEPLGNLGRRATAGSDSVETANLAGQQGTWNILEAALKAKYGMLKGGGILRTLRLVGKVAAGPSANADRLVSRMFFEPDLAVHLLTRPVREVGTDTWNAKLNRLLAIGEGAREMTDDPEDPE